MSAPLHRDLKQVDPQTAWQPWTPHAGQPFDAKWAGHLFRRAAFGANPDEIRKAVRNGFDPTLQTLLVGDERAANRLSFLEDTGELIARADEPDALRGWWLYAMLNGGHRLREKMVLFWHNHFATSIAKVRSTSLMFRQNQLLRRLALGKFGPLLQGVSRDSAMLVWLDSNENVKAHPNENFAREVMELFTIGVGNYTENDVRGAARAFTGWHINGDDGFVMNEAEHDAGSKTVLSKTGNWDGDDVLRILLEQPACGDFLAAKLYRFFVGEVAPPKKLLDPLAAQLRGSDFDIGATVATILRSRLFFSEHAYQKRIKSPVEFVLGAVRAAWPGPIATVDLVAPLESMGQSLFAPPNVKGWTGGKNWLTDATLLARHNFAEKVAGAQPAPAAPPPAVPGPIPRQLSATLPQHAAETTLVSHQPSEWDFTGDPVSKALQPSPGALWYVQKMKARTPSAINRAIGEQFFPSGLPGHVSRKLESFLGDPETIVSQTNIREAIHAVMCLPEYQLC